VGTADISNIIGGCWSAFGKNPQKIFATLSVTAIPTVKQET
jgi:hypothetical protein